MSNCIKNCRLCRNIVISTAVTVVTVAGVDTLVIDIPVMFTVMGIMTLPALFRGKLSRWQGILLLCVYAGFCVFQFFI